MFVSTTFGNEPFTVTKCRATEDQFQQFVLGASAVFRQWTALHLVTLHCDPQAGETLLHQTLSWFQESGEVYSDELELFFEDFFAASRSVLVEDDSMKEVGDVLHEMYCRCCKGDYSTVQQFLAMESTFQQLDPVGQSMNGTVEDDVDLLNDGNEPTLEEEEQFEVASAPQLQKKPNRRKKFNKSSDGWNEVC